MEAQEVKGYELDEVSWWACRPKCVTSGLRIAIYVTGELQYTQSCRHNIRNHAVAIYPSEWKPIGLAVWGGVGLMDWIRYGELGGIFIPIFRGFEV